MKGATKEYPAKYLDTLQYEKGDHHVATSTIEGIPMLALGWHHRTLKKFLATCGTTVEGHPHKKKRYRVSEDGKSSEAFLKTGRRPKLVEEYFNSASKIDIHNHLRQGSLALEEAWGTKKWHHRVFSTMLRRVEVDTFLVYRALHADGHSINHREFTEKLALALIHNNFGVSISPVAAQSKGNKDLPHSTHHFMPLITLEQYQSKQGCAGGSAWYMSVFSRKRTTGTTTV